MNKIYLSFAALLLVLCQACDSADATKLRAENRELKIRLAALGQDTTSAATVYASAPSTPADTSTSIPTTASPTLSLSAVAGAGAPGATAKSIWTVNHYVNDFGDKTEKGYITNVGFIAGSFSNSATQDSPLNVQFLIDKDMDASIQLFEYAGNNPVKAYDYDSYSVNVKDRDGKALRLRGTNYKSNRLTIEKPDSKKLHDALLKGGKL